MGGGWWETHISKNSKWSWCSVERRTTLWVASVWTMIHTNLSHLVSKELHVAFVTQPVSWRSNQPADVSEASSTLVGREGSGRRLSYAGLPSPDSSWLHPSLPGEQAQWLLLKRSQNSSPPHPPGDLWGCQKMSTQRYSPTQNITLALSIRRMCPSLQETPRWVFCLLPITEPLWKHILAANEEKVRLKIQESTARGRHWSRLPN